MKKKIQNKFIETYGNLQKWKVIKSTANSALIDEILIQNNLPTNKPEEVFEALSQNFPILAQIYLFIPLFIYYTF